MIERGAQVNFQNGSGESTLFGFPSTLLTSSFRASNRVAPLHRAVLNLQAGAVMASLLLKRGARPDITNERGESPLHWAVRMNRCVSVSTRVNSRQGQNWSFLISLCSTQLGIVLARAGADVAAEAFDGTTPMQLARETGNTSILEYFLSMEQEKKRTRHAMSLYCVLILACQLTTRMSLRSLARCMHTSPSTNYRQTPPTGACIVSSLHGFELSFCSSWTRKYEGFTPYDRLKPVLPAIVEDLISFLENNGACAKFYFL